MKAEVRKEFTEEEIKGFMNDLAKATGSYEKIKKVLSDENLPLLLSYLRKIGVNSTLLEYAGVVELTRKNMIRVLSNASTNGLSITEDGIRCIASGDQETSLYVTEGGRLNIFYGRYFTMPDENGNVNLMEKRKNKDVSERKINKYGIVDLQNEWYSGDGWYIEERKFNGDIPVISVDADDGSSYGYRKEYVDFGEVLFDSATDSPSFEENYNRYTSLFPRTKVWYDSYYWLDDKDISEFSKTLDDENLKKEIEDTERVIYYLNKSIRIKKESIGEYKTKIEQFVAYLNNIKRKTPIGKDVIDEILNSAREVEKTESLNIEDEEQKEEIKQDEKSDLQEMLRARKEEVKRLSKKLDVLTENNRYYRNVVSVLEKGIREIPLIGKRLTERAKRYDTKNVKKEDKTLEDL